MTLSLLSISSLNATQDILWSVACPGREAAERKHKMRLQKGDSRLYYKALNSITSTFGLYILAPSALSIWASEQITHVPFLRAISPCLTPWGSRLIFFYFSISVVFILTIAFFRKINDRLFFEKQTEGSKECIVVKKNLPAWKACALSLTTLGYPIWAQETRRMGEYPRGIAAFGGFLWFWHIGIAGFTIYKAASIWSMHSLVFAEYFLISSFFLITNCIVYPTIWHNLLSLKYRDCHLIAAVSHFVYHVLAAIALWRIDVLNNFAPLLSLPPTTLRVLEMYLTTNGALHIVAALASIELHRRNSKEEEPQYRKTEGEGAPETHPTPFVHTI